MASPLNKALESNNSSNNVTDDSSITKPDVMPTNTASVAGLRLADAVSEVEDNVSIIMESEIVVHAPEPATVENEDESEYEYEDEDDAGFSSFLVSDQTRTNAATVADSTEPTRIEEETMKWKEPSKEAVSMSLRAERETTGGKRRLASDLYKIMMRDTEEAGFSLEPKDEEKMDKWLIKLFQFDEDSNLAKDMEIVGVDHVELEMCFPDQYPFEPPFVRVVKPKFKRHTGFVMNGALCMELLTKDGWNPINDIESVIVSIRSLLVVGDGRLAAVADLSEDKRSAILNSKKRKSDEDGTSDLGEQERQALKAFKADVGGYTAQEAKAAYEHLSDYHKKKGWDTSGWWAKKG